MKGDRFMESVRVVQIGCGKMSKYIMRYIYEKNGSVVGAVDINPDLIGKDISAVMESESKGVLIQDVSCLDKILKKTKPNVAIITTMSVLNDIGEEIRTCVKNGINVITTCEEAFFASNSNPVLYDELNALAKAFNVTIIGCGYQDVFWGNMIYSICASTERITKIKGCSSYNVEDYGIALAKAHGAGYTAEEFDKEIAVINRMSEEEREELIAKKEFFPSYMWNVVGWLAKKLNLHIVSMKQECIPVMTDGTLESETLGMTLSTGMVRGMEAVVTATTKENIILEVECIGKVYTSEEADMNEWTIFGEPTTSVKNETPATVELTCADVVNRIPHVMKAESGFLDTTDLPEPVYIVNDFQEYL